MFALLKAAALGALLTFVVAYVLGSGGSTAGALHVRGVVVQEIQFYWSWVLFLTGTGISFGIILMME